MDAGSILARGRRRRGFTLVELLVVLVILGLVMGLVGMQAIGWLGRAKSDVARMQIQTFGQALDLYRIDVGRYPVQDEGLGVLVARPASAPRWNGPYLKGREIPPDPWGRPYLYEMPGRHGLGYDLYSLGADGVRGGDGENADVGNW